jgi:hypothetical protein
MADTALTLIMGSMRLLGLLASGEPPTASEQTDGLAALNDMLDSWSTESLLIPNKVREVFPLVASQQSYTMGTGGNFNTSRPMKIENALVQLVGTSPALELPMQILTKDEYAGITLKALLSTFPLYAYIEGTYPLETINVWPVPQATNNLVLYSWKPLAELSTLQTALSLPPGYQRALRYALAIELAPEFGKQVSETILGIAMEAKQNLKRMNFKPQYLRVDDALLGNSGVYDWRTDTYR